MSAYAITHHKYNDIKKYKLVRLSFLRWRFNPIREDKCIFCGVKEDRHEKYHERTNIWI